LVITISAAFLVVAILGAWAVGTRARVRASADPTDVE
jgi:hypothetical protein